MTSEETDTTLEATRRSSKRRTEAPAGPRLARKRRERRRRRRVLTTAGLVLVAVVAMVALTAVTKYRSWAAELRPDEEEAEAIDLALTPEEEAPPAGDPFYVLLLGSDKREGDEVARSDTILLARVDPADRSVIMLSIPRDTRVAIPGQWTTKINAASALGGTALMIETVREFTGLPVDEVVELDFTGFAKIVDALGGVWLDVESPISDLQAANYNRDAMNLDEGRQLLDGAHALTFVRSRQFPDGDYSRMRNQQQFIREVANQALTASNIAKLPTIIDLAAEHITTTMSVSEIISLARLFNGIGADSITGYTVPSRTGPIGGISYVIPDEEAGERLFAAIAAGETPPVEGLGSMPLDPKVAVLNGGVIEGAAGATADMLEEEGFHVTTIADTMPSEDASNAVYYEGSEFREWAGDVAQALGGWPVRRAHSGVDCRGDVTVIVVTPPDGPDDTPTGL